MFVCQVFGTSWKHCRRGLCHYILRSKLSTGVDLTNAVGAPLFSKQRKHALLQESIDTTDLSESNFFEDLSSNDFLEIRSMSVTGK